MLGVEVHRARERYKSPPTRHRHEKESHDNKTQAASQNHAKARCNLGIMFASGIGVARDDSKAARYYLAAATGGVPRAKLQAHLREECPLTQQKCPNPGCSVRCARQEMQQHLQACPSKRVLCQHCRQELERYELPGHLQRFAHHCGHRLPTEDVAACAGAKMAIPRETD